MEHGETSKWIKQNKMQCTLHSIFAAAACSFVASVILLISELNFKCCFQVDLIDLQWQFVFTMRSHFVADHAVRGTNETSFKYYYPQTIPSSTLLFSFQFVFFLLSILFVNFQFENTKLFMPSAIIMCFEFGLFVWSFHWSFGTCRTSYWNAKKKWKKSHAISGNQLHTNGRYTQTILHNSFPSQRYNFAFQQFDFRLDNCKYG